MDKEGKGQVDLRDRVDGEFLLIGVGSAAAVREDSLQLVVARLPELELAALGAQVAGHHRGGLDDLAVASQRPVQRVATQFPEISGQVDLSVRVERSRQIETSLAHRVDLDTAGGGRLTAQFVSGLCDKGIEARFSNEPMAAVGSQLKLGCHFLAIL